MSTITNIKINYMVLEQILRVTGTYKLICDEHEFLDVIFKQAKTGKIDTLFRDDEAAETTFSIIEGFTGLPIKYWSGVERIKFGISCVNGKLKYDGGSINTVDLTHDEPYKNEEENIGHAYHGILYQEQLKNPLHLEYEDLYSEALGKKASKDDNIIEKAIEDIGELYSLRGLLITILINMSDEIDIIEKAHIYKHKKWEDYTTTVAVPKDGITYSPKFVKFEDGDVKTIIRNIYDLGYVFRFQDVINGKKIV